jgi:uncharacterized membrane-anchored protein
LAWLTLAFAGALIALAAFGRCDDGATSLPCGIMLGMLLYALIIGGSLSAVALGITAFRAARQSQRWGWFGSFLALTLSIVTAPTLMLVILNAPLSPSLVNRLLPMLVWAVLILTPALAILALVYLRVTEATGESQSVPDPH